MKTILLVLSLIQSVPVAHNDQGQTGANRLETILTPSNVSAGKFGLLGSWTLDGFSFSQPLVGSFSGTNYVITTTLANTVAAWNADRPGTSALWSVNFGTGRGGWANNTSSAQQLYGSSFGIIGTPVIDFAGGFVYVVSSTTTPNYLLHKLNLSDGSAAATAVTISASVPGTGSSGDPTSGPNLLFSASMTTQRCALILSPDASKVYVSFGGGSAGFIPPPWHGWVMGYNVSNLTQFAAYCSSPNGNGASIWLSGGAPAMDASGNLYVITGSEGDWDGVTEFSDSMLKLSPALVLLDWFTPSNHVLLDANDFDFGAGRVMLIPGTTLAVGSGKDFNVYVVDTACMGHLQGSSGCTLQTFKTNAVATITKFSGAYGGVVANGILFLPTTAGSLYQFSCPSGICNTTPTTTQTNTYGFPGPAQMSLSSNGTSNSILWVVTAASSSFTSLAAGTLRALDPSNGLAELWNSGSTVGNMAKFVSPTVVNGRIFLPNNNNQLLMFGLIPATQIRGQTTLRGRTVLR